MAYLSTFWRWVGGFPAASAMLDDDGDRERVVVVVNVAVTWSSSSSLPPGGARLTPTVYPEIAARFRSMVHHGFHQRGIVAPSSVVSGVR